MTPRPHVPDPSDRPRRSPDVIEVDGYGRSIVSSSHDEECMRSLVHVELPKLGRNPDGDSDAPWCLSLYPDEALALGLALIRHAGHVLTT